MAQQTINTGSAPNDGTGDPARTAFGKVNDNFTELYGVNLVVPSLLYSNDFTADTSGIGFAAFNGATITNDFGNSRVRASHASSMVDRGASLWLSPNNLQNSTRYLVVLNVTLDTQTYLRVLSQWSSPEIARITRSGWHAFEYTSTSNASANYMAIVGSLASSSGFYLNYAGIYQYSGSGTLSEINDVLPPAGVLTELQSLGAQFGRGAYANAAATTGSTTTGCVAAGYMARAEAGVAVGVNAVATNANADTPTGGSAAKDTCLGNNASCAVNTTYNASATAGPKTALGSNAQAHSWRATAIGHNTIAAGTASTVVGCGGFAPGSHQTVIGRGSVFTLGTGEYENATNIGGDRAGTHAEFFLANGWAHRFDTPPTGITISDFTTPSNIECRIHGQDAFDSRANASGQPGYAANVAGGHMAMCAGRGVGTGAGGENRFYSAPAGTPGDNTKNALVLYGKFDSLASSSANETGFLLYDIQAATLRRVRFGASDSGGAGYRALITPN